MLDTPSEGVTEMRETRTPLEGVEVRPAMERFDIRLVAGIGRTAYVKLLRKELLKCGKPAFLRKE